MIDPTLHNATQNEVFAGKLIKATETGLVELPFCYEILSGRRFDAVLASLPGADYVAVSTIIRTSRIDLSFAEGDKIRLIDNSIMTVRTVEEYHNKNLARMGLPSLEKFTITLDGGGK